MNINFDSLSREYAQLLTTFTIANFVFWILIHIIFGIAVYKDAKNREVALVGPFLWALITLLGGVLFAGVYWVVNRLALKENLSESKSFSADKYNNQRGVDNTSYQRNIESRLNKFKSSFNKT